MVDYSDIICYLVFKINMAEFNLANNNKLKSYDENICRYLNTCNVFNFDHYEMAPFCKKNETNVVFLNFILCETILLNIPFSFALCSIFTFFFTVMRTINDRGKLRIGVPFLFRIWFTFSLFPSTALIWRCETWLKVTVG